MSYVDPNFARDYARLQRSHGIHLHGAQAYIEEAWKNGDDGFKLAMDAQPGLVSTSSAGIPAFLTTIVDPSVFKVLTTPNKAAEIFGEAKKGSWLDETAMFPMVERTGEVSSYGDYNNNGHAGANVSFPQRQAYLFQTVVEYGEREMERMGLARVSWAATLQEAAVLVLDKFLNLTYFRGVQGLQNYGLQNDPGLLPSATASVKAAGGTAWVLPTGVVNGTANEIYADIQTLVALLVSQSNGLVEETDEMTLAMAPLTHVGLSATNQFGINVGDLLKKNFPNLTVKTAVQYGAVTATNPQGLASGGMIQLIATKIEGQDTGYCSFNEKLRTHPVVRDLSSFKQKQTSGTWGAIIRQPYAISSMIGA
jgi:hypothetical protein